MILTQYTDMVISIFQFESLKIISIFDSKMQFVLSEGGL